MILTIENSRKADIFATIFSHLKIFADGININFYEDHLYIQGMDYAHISLFEIKIMQDWFDKYEILPDDIKEIGVNSVILSKILHTRQEPHSINLGFEGQPDKINIDFRCTDKEIIDRYFEIPLVNIDQEHLAIPNTEYEAQFTIPSKTFAKLIDELALFNDSLEINCTEENITLTASGDEGKMTAKISHEDLEEYSIITSDGESKVNVSLTLKYFHDMSQFHKISPEITLQISEQWPTELRYLFEDNQPGDPAEFSTKNNSYIRFFLAPKIISE